MYAWTAGVEKDAMNINYAGSRRGGQVIAEDATAETEDMVPRFFSDDHIRAYRREANDAM